MATQKAISTISYNSEAFLKEKLDTWVKEHIIQAYMYICHKGEEGDKDHIHVRIEPNKKLDPMDLTEKLKEYALGSDKPLGVRPWRPSKEEDWILYAVHDKEYLDLKYGGAEKGEKLPYEMNDIKVSDMFDLEVAFIRAKAYLKHSVPNVVKQLKEGVKPINLVEQGQNVYTVNACMRALSQYAYGELSANYDKVKEELLKVQTQLDNLVEAVHKRGFAIECDDDGNVELVDVPFK